MIVQFLTINIEAEHQKVFRFVSNYSNDRKWRSEIISTTLIGATGVGNVAIERSFLSKRIPKYTRKLHCTDFAKDSSITYETISGSIHYLKNSRKVVQSLNNSTDLTYQLEFDPSVVKFGLGFRIPAILINMVTKRSMKKYLKTLKIIIESSSN